MFEFEGIVRNQARQFYWPGAEREDVEQEAWLALCEARPNSMGLAKAVVRRRLTSKLIAAKRLKRNAIEVELTDHAKVEEDGRLDARLDLQRILATPLTDLERVAIGRALRGESCGRPKALDNALQSAKRKLAA